MKEIVLVVFPTTAMAEGKPKSLISHESVGRAADALLKWLKAKSKHEKAQLFDHDEFIYLIFTLKKIPPKARTNPYKIPLPHPIHNQSSLEICLIIDDRPRSALTSEAAKKKIQSESIPVSKVLKLSKLRTDYGPYEAKRKLCGSYDFFFADKRVIPFLPKLLGKQFFKKKKTPVPIDLSHKNWKEQIEQVCSSTLLYLRTGTCCIIKVGLVSQERDEIVENAIAAVNGAVEIVPKKWGNVRSLHLKSLGSVALPIYQAVPEIGFKIEGFKEEAVGKDQEIATEEKKEKKEEKKRKTMKKRGRIHEVNYMDSNVEEPMEDMIEEDKHSDDEEPSAPKCEVIKKKSKKEKRQMVCGNGDAIEDDKLGSLKEDMAAKIDDFDGVGNDETTKTMKLVKKRRKSESKHMKKSATIVHEVVDDGSRENETVNKKAKKKILSEQLPETIAELVNKGRIELVNGSINADKPCDKKKKKKPKAELEEGKENKMKNKEGNDKIGRTIFDWDPDEDDLLDE